MIIEIKNASRVAFGSLREGEVFRAIFDGDPCIAMKINYSEDTCGDGINAIDLSDGEWFYLTDDYKVEPLKAKLVIE